MKTMCDKHHEIEDEAYKMLRKLVGLNMSSTLINKLTEIRNDLNTRYKGEYHVEFVPDDVNKLLGMNISVEDMKVELGRLGFDYELNGDKFIVTIPSRI